MAKHMCKKEPVTVKIIQKDYNSLYEVNIYNMRTICAILVSYTGFLRSQEMLAISRSNIVFDN